MSAGTDAASSGAGRLDGAAHVPRAALVQESARTFLWLPWMSKWRGWDGGLISVGGGWRGQTLLDAI